MTDNIAAVVSPGEGSGLYGGTKMIQFRNNTNTEIFVQCIYIDDYQNNKLYSIDTDSIIPGGAERYTFTLDKNTTSTNLGPYKALWCNYDYSGGYSSMTRTGDNVWQRSSSAWPRFGKGSNGTYYLHPTRGNLTIPGHTGNDGESGILRYVADRSGTLKVTAEISDYDVSDYHDGVKGFVAHIPVGNLAANKRPNADQYTGKYLDIGSTTKIYDTPGTREWTVPAGVTTVKILCVGGGGGGAAGYQNGWYASGGGGGGGSVDFKEIAVTPGDTYTVITGSGGSGGSGGTNRRGNGTDGGYSRFYKKGQSSTSLIWAAGGSKGNGYTGGAGGNTSESSTVRGLTGGNGYYDGGISRNGQGGDVRSLDQTYAALLGIPSRQCSTGCTLDAAGYTGNGSYGGVRGVYDSGVGCNWKAHGQHNTAKHGSTGGGGAGHLSTGGSGGHGIVVILPGDGIWSYDGNLKCYTASAFNGLINANLVSNWHPEKRISGSPGLDLSAYTGNTHKSGRSNFSEFVTSRFGPLNSVKYRGLIDGNIDTGSLVTTKVKGPKFLMSGGQKNNDSLRCRYIRFYPHSRQAHPSFRCGAWNAASGWNLGDNATRTANACWRWDDHGPQHSKLGNTSGRGGYSTEKQSPIPGSEWVQLDFGSIQNVDYIGTKGRHETRYGNQYVTKFLVMCSTDGVHWHLVTKHCGETNFQPQMFEKEIKVKAGDFIDLVVQPGDHNTNYDTTKVRFDVESTIPGSGSNGSLYFDNDGCIRNIGTGLKDGVVLANGKSLNIEVQSNVKPEGYVTQKNHKLQSASSSLKVDYRCDKLTTAGAEWTEMVDTRYVDVESTVADWYKVKHKETGKSLDMYVAPGQLDPDTDKRWVYILGWGWTYLQPTDKLFNEHTWAYLNSTSTEGGGAKGWVLFDVKTLPVIWSNILYESHLSAGNSNAMTDSFVFLGQLNGSANYYPAKISAVTDGNNPTKKCTFTYKFYTMLTQSGWSLHDVKTVVSNSSSPVWVDDPKFFEKIPPAHDTINYELGHGGGDDEWYNSFNVDITPPADLGRGTAYRTQGQQTMPLIWSSVPQIKNMPRKVSVMIRKGTSGGDWVVMEKFSSVKFRSNKRPVYRSSDGKYELRYVRSGANYNWYLETDTETFSYYSPEPDTGSGRKFPADGSYYYSEKTKNSRTYGAWKSHGSASTYTGELMLFFIWGDTGITQITSSQRKSTGNIKLEKAECRADIRKYPADEYSSFAYTIPALKDIPDTRNSNSRIYVMEINGGSTATREVGLVRERAGVYELSGSRYLTPNTFIRLRVIYPGHPGHPFFDGGWSGFTSMTPSPVPMIITAPPAGSSFKGFIVAQMQMPTGTTLYSDCGYDTKFTLQLRSKPANGIIETLYNVGVGLPDSVATTSNSHMAFLGVNVTGGKDNVEAGTINDDLLEASDYYVRFHSYGDETGYTSFHRSTDTASVGYTNLWRPPVSSYPYSLFDNHTPHFSGNSSRGSFKTSDLCCFNTTDGTSDNNKCIDFKQRVLDYNNCPTGVCLKTPRGGKTAELMMVRYWGGIRPYAAYQFRSKSGYGPANSFSGYDENGPIKHEFHNTHPFSDVVIRVDACVDVASDDQAGACLGVFSNQNGKIFDPYDHGNAYMTGPISGDNLAAQYPYYFQGGPMQWGSTVDNNNFFTGGVHNFVGRRNGLSDVANHNGDPNHSTAYKMEKFFGYWRIKQNERMNFRLYAALDCPGHGGYGQYEGVLVRWFKMTVVRWPNDT